MSFNRPPNPKSFKTEDEYYLALDAYYAKEAKLRERAKYKHKDKEYLEQE